MSAIQTSDVKSFLEPGRWAIPYLGIAEGRQIRHGTVKRIHVNKQVIAQNRKNGTNEPPITVQTSKGAVKAQKVYIAGPSLFVHSPHKPLKCGARVWIETKATVVVS